MADDTGMHTMLVELLFDAPPALDAGLIASLAARSSPSVRLVADAPHVLLSHDALTQAHADGLVTSIQTAILPADPAGPGGETDLSQTWDFPQAAATLGRATARLVLAELFGMPQSTSTRIMAYSAVLRAAIEALQPVALWAPHSRQLIRPASVLDNHLTAFVNVRMFDIEESDGAIVMDTVGLHVFGLPDAQCHFRGLDPTDVANILYNSAAYILEHGDVIEDGNTIPGIRRRDKWRCRHEMALIEPERVVVDINTGRRHAVGDRR